jgi:phosphoribosylformimino-5-aminoimidazole carboxamide ribotide isomerase
VTLELIAAIDLLGGKCVRLTKGDYAHPIVYYKNPVDAAKAFEQAGLKRVHLVDLDGAKAGSIKNLKVLESIAKSTNLIIDFGGGLKKDRDAETVFNAGAAMLTIGSLAVLEPPLVESWIKVYGTNKILVGADVLYEQIKISGWLVDGGVSVFEFITKMLSIGVKNIFCTDISKDGMMSGPSVELYKKILKSFPDLTLIASGGITSLTDLHQLQSCGCSGAILGKAIYEKLITLEQLAEFNK